MKIKSMEAPSTANGVPYDEGFAEKIDPKTGRDIGDLAPGSIELYPVNVVARDAGTTHDGDMGRLGKSE
jgi:hypothetical protein